MVQDLLVLQCRVHADGDLQATLGASPASCEPGGQTVSAVVHGGLAYVMQKHRSGFVFTNEVQEGAQQLAASSKNLQTVDDLMGSLRRNPSMRPCGSAGSRTCAIDSPLWRRWICGIACACVALYSLIPAAAILPLALQVEDCRKSHVLGLTRQQT